MKDQILSQADLGCDTWEQAESILNAMETVEDFHPLHNSQGFAVKYNTDDEDAIDADWRRSLESLVVASQDVSDGVVLLPSGFWGVTGSDADEDDAWGVYRTREAAIAAREALENSDWNADVVRLDLQALREHEEKIESLGLSR